MEDGFPAPSWSIEEHIRYMDQAGIDLSLISVSSPHFHSGMRMEPLFQMLNEKRAVVNLINSGTLERYPNVKIIVPHCGSFLPNIIDRLTGITKVLAAKGIGRPVEVETGMKSLYFDLAGDVLPAGIRILRTLADEDHILFGGDFPYTPCEMITGKVNRLMQCEEIKDILPKVMYQNAEKLFNLND